MLTFYFRFNFVCRVSYVEIYNEIIHDLLDGHTELKIRENEKKDGIILQCKEEVVNNVQAIMEKLKLGNVERKTASTKMNARSSRSHAIFSIVSIEPNRFLSSSPISFSNKFKFDFHLIFFRSSNLLGPKLLRSKVS